MDSTELTKVFAVGDMVVYPSQGIGYIDSTETRRDKKYLKIKMKSSSMDVLLPVDKVSNFGLRHLASEEEAKNALNELSIKHKSDKSDWKSRLQKNQDLLKSGDISSVALVVNTLYRRSKIKDLPTMERKVYESALVLLVDESSSVLGISSDEMRKTIFKKLEA